MSTKNALGLFAGTAWAAVAIAHSAPANAIAITLQSGTYASCSSANSYSEGGYCWDDVYQVYEYYTYYQQQIKMWSVACGSGGTCSSTGHVYVDGIYSTGRKVATGGPLRCASGFHAGVNVYTFGDCAC